MNQNTHPLLTHLIATAKAMGGECHTIEVPAGGFSAPALEKMLNDILLGKPPKEPSEGTKKAMAEARKAAFPPIDPSMLPKEPKSWVEHPAAKAARLKAEARKKQRAKMTEEVKLAQDNDVIFYTAGAHTAAVCVEKDVFRIATTVRHPTDSHDPLAAKHTALKRLIEGQYSLLRLPPAFRTVREFLSNMFEGY